MKQKSCYRRALAGSEAQLGRSHPDTLTWVYNLANVLMKQKHFADAEPLMRRALAGFESHLGAGHPHTLNSIRRLAKLLEATGSIAEALGSNINGLKGRTFRGWAVERLLDLSGEFFGDTMNLESSWGSMTVKDIGDSRRHASPDLRPRPFKGQ